MDSIHFSIFSMAGLFSLLSLFSLLVVFILLKERKYWYLPGSVLLVIAFALFAKDELTGSDTGDFALAGVIAISIIESIVELRRLSKEDLETDEEKQRRKTTMIWGYTWLFLKALVVYFLLTN